MRSSVVPFIDNALECELFNQIAAAPIQNNSVAPAGVDSAGFDTSGLRVPDGQSLLLVGGNINLNGGSLNALGGRVELGGLAWSVFHRLVCSS